MRIAVGGFQHETNTFAPTKADYAAFAQSDSWPALQRGPALLTAFADMNVPITGFLDAAKADSQTLLPLVWCSATPSAPVTDDAFERVMGMMLEDLAAALSTGLDGVYLDLHGAMVTETYEDGEGEILARVRRMIGSDIPLVASLDLHANVSQRMVDEADALIAYRTYPHVDMRDTGVRAHAHLTGLLSGLPRQAKAFRKLDYIIPLTAQCTLIEPARHIYAHVAHLDGKMLGNGEVSVTSFATGFPPVDISMNGPSVFAYADTQSAADEAAGELADMVTACEPRFVERLWSARDAVAHAIATSSDAGGPVVLADTQDNPGAGGNGDTVGILREMLLQDAPLAALGVLYDPQAASMAAEAGEGASITLSLGAKTGGADEAPIEETFEVAKVGSGNFLATGPFYGGSHMSLGTTVLLRKGGVHVVVSSRKAQCADQEMFRHVGIEPSRLRVLVVKSSVHFRADFGPIAREVLVVESPGPNVADLTRLPFRHLRKGLRITPLGPAFEG
ncbi:MAG: microcystin degradation protein MlrC [Rhizobiales bacterium]|nr:microcystin degradation protein MlrC [Hyphomicrobiales bacterium]